MPKIANIRLSAHKPYLKGIDLDFLFYGKFCLVEILKRWKQLGVKRNAFFTILKTMKITKTVKMAWNIANNKTNNQNHKIHTIRIAYMIFEISCCVIKKNCMVFNFHFKNKFFLGIYNFGPKTSKNDKNCAKNSQNHQIAFLSFTFHPKKSTFWHWPFFSDLWHGIAHIRVDIHVPSSYS